MERSAFLDKYECFWKSQGKEVPPCTVKWRYKPEPIDVFALHKAVEKLGGSAIVREKGLWSAVGDAFNPPSASSEGQSLSVSPFHCVLSKKTPMSHCLIYIEQVASILSALRSRRRSRGAPLLRRLDLSPRPRNEPDTHLLRTSATRFWSELVAESFEAADKADPERSFSLPCACPIPAQHHCTF